jgi:hypothetical protein
MELLIQSALPSLANDLVFQVEKVSGADHSYTGSFLKLLLHRKDTIIAIYFFKNGTYISPNILTDDEKSILDGWLETVRSKKIEQEKHYEKRHQS